MHAYMRAMHYMRTPEVHRYMVPSRYEDKHLHTVSCYHNAVLPEEHINSSK